MQAKIRKIFLLISVAWLLLLLIAPYMVPSGTILYLDGKANSIDYYSLWEKLDPLPRTIYLFGDYNCHQKYSRSWVLNGNQLPVCTRDMGMFLGFCLGFLASICIKTESLNLWAISLSVFPDKIRNFVRQRNIERHIAIVLGLILSLPLVIDGFTQAYTNYESTNPIRFATGILFGFVFVYCICCLNCYLMASIRKNKNSNEQKI